MPVVTLPHKWVPRDYQMPVWKYFEATPLRARALCLWHRRAGKDLLALNLTAMKAHERVGTYWMVYPTFAQGREIIWEGKTRDGRAFLDYIPDELVGSINSTFMRVDLNNGSSIRVVGTDNVDRRVGTNPVGIVMSEFSLQDPSVWDFLRPILKENDGWALFIYTPRGKNHGYKLYEMARKNPRWFVDVRKAGSGPECTKREDGSPVFSDEAIEEERGEGMPEEMIQQEYKCSFEAGLVGAYYSQVMARLQEQGHITSVPHDPKLGVSTAWDIGVGDSTTIWFFQQYGQEVRVIDYFEASGEGLPHFVKALRGQLPGSEHRVDYVYLRHYAPHDITVREWAAGGKSRIETARSLGVKFLVGVRHEVPDGIEAVRNLLPSCWFDEKRCERGIEALKSYRKEFDQRLRVYRDSPLHDWSSHGADAFRYLAYGLKPVGRKKQKPDFRQVDDEEYDYLNGAHRDPDFVSWGDSGT